MNDSQQEIDLISQFIGSLSLDPSAPVPSGLDNDLAEFIRTMALSSNELGKDQRSRIWQRALFAATSQRTNKEKPIMSVLVNKPIEPAVPKKFGFLTLFAALIVVAFLGMLSLIPHNGGTSGTIFQGGTETPTPEATLEVTPENAVAQATPVFENPIKPGETVKGMLTKEKLEVTYSVQMPLDGIAHAVVRSNDFNVALSYSVLNPMTGSGGGGGGGGGPILSPITLADIYVPLQKGHILSVNVTSISHVETGEFTLSVSTAPARKLNYNEGIGGTIDEKNDFAYFTFHALPGDKISVSVQSNEGADLMMELQESPDNMAQEAYESYQLLGGPLTVQDDDSGAGQNPEFYNVVIKTENDYNILLKPASSGQYGSYSLWLAQQEPLSLDEAVQPVYLTNKVNNGAVAFEGKAGQTVQLHTKVIIGKGLVRAIVVQNGKIIATFNIQGNADESVSIPEDGKVVILLDNAGVEIMERLGLELSLTR
jgi:hypothetical protein